jgi:uncharacterized protein YjiS (DUF1127 family)
MATMFDRFAASVRNRANYRRTVAALKSMPLDVALDLDIFPGDAERIAERRFCLPHLGGRTVGCEFGRQRKLAALWFSRP